ETMDENLFDVIEDFIDEKREDYEDWLESQES
ncbi:heterodisulfide reductase subunit C, partial [Acidithiobacillus thiooxidans]|nr:heterodisulfide reductase subunit C [Acidithiobacillus thiooxidans]